MEQQIRVCRRQFEGVAEHRVRRLVRRRLLANGCVHIIKTFVISAFFSFIIFKVL